ncbi:putative colanic acid biosysnthesis UDP-glucose lipid carrier transferase [Pollutimonas bauzanensis]|uniref:Putative colanic acid biosysnthesis UDP-glucose lipid carrier transferase n=2 Tax=Pollutimonas bauzanensis TaxID=658167 RepID=A0A1M6BL82_9BURK|nr:putative colanic acid biosysnthesis UDP-glucose lipid carrier transferase [Pollutimonas bauzanensis]
MLAERYPLAFLAGFVEFFLVVFGAHAAYFLRFDDWALSSWYEIAVVVIALVVIVCQIVLGTYSSWRGREWFRQIGRVYIGWLIALAIVTGLAVFLKVSQDYSRVWLSTTLAVSLALITLFRFGIYFFLRQIRLRGRNLKGVLVVEVGNSADELRHRQSELPEHGYRVLKNVKLVRSDAWLDELVSLVIQTGAHEVWLCLPLQEGETIKTILHALRHLTVEVRYLPDMGDMPLLNHSVSNIAGLYSLDISCSPMDGPARIVKRMEDLILGCFFLVLILPVCLLIAIGIKLTSSGPVIFKQYRMGINGRKFKVYKFRSMELHDEPTGTVTQASFGDPRITPLGAFLRRTSLDELPQFYNVIQGRMSIVGPRPHALAHNEQYKDLVESYMKRHKVKPGITGWAQVNGFRGETDTVDKMEKRVEYDLWYINNWSLGLDLKIIFLTVYRGFVNNKP